MPGKDDDDDGGGGDGDFFAPIVERRQKLYSPRNFGAQKAKAEWVFFFFLSSMQDRFWGGRARALKVSLARANSCAKILRFVARFNFAESFFILFPPPPAAAAAAAAAAASVVVTSKVHFRKLSPSP